MNRDRQSGAKHASDDNTGLRQVSELGPVPNPSLHDSSSTNQTLVNQTLSSEIAHQWFRTHGDDLFSFAMKRVGNRTIAEDLVQETFLALIQILNRQDPVESPRAFLISILKRKIADHFRRECRQEEWAQRSRTESMERHGSDRSEWPDPSESLCEQEIKSALRDCVDRLPAPMRQAFELRVIRRFSVEEAADLMGVSRTVLASRLYRGRLAVRDCLDYLFS